MTSGLFQVTIINTDLSLRCKSPDRKRGRDICEISSLSTPTFSHRVLRKSNFDKSGQILYARNHSMSRDQCLSDNTL